MLPRPHPSVIYQPMPDGAVLFAPASEMYFGLNEAGVCIWEGLMTSADSVDALCDALMSKYPDAAAATVRADVSELLHHLEERGLVHAASQGSSPPGPSSTRDPS